jgi:hypothetical protein
MKVLWQDGVGSFLDPSATDPGLPNSDAAASSQGGGDYTAFAADGMLWEPMGTPLGGVGIPVSDTGLAASNASAHFVWSDGRSAPQIWDTSDAWLAKSDSTGGLGPPDLHSLTPNQPGGDATPLLWQPPSLPQPIVPVAQPNATAVPQNGNPAAASTPAADNGGCTIGGVWYPDGTKNILVPGEETHWNLAPVYLECRDGTAYFQNTNTVWIPLPGH